MDKAAFQANMPGRFEPTRFDEARWVDGRRESRWVDGMAFVPDPLPPKIDRTTFLGRVFDEVQAATDSLARLDSAMRMLPSAELLVRPLMFREAQVSSEIENTIASVAEAAAVGAGDVPPRPEAQEVYNYVETLEQALVLRAPLTVRLLKRAHATLLHNVRGEDKSPGQLRSRQVYIGGGGTGFGAARFVPPPAGRLLEQCLYHFEQFVNLNDESREQSGLTPLFPRLVEIAMAHYQFEAIHPFSDGNGRLGRVLIAVLLKRGGILEYPAFVSGYFERNRQRYYDLLLRVSTHADWEAWVRFFCEGLASDATDALTRVRLLSELRSRWIDRVTAKRASILLVQLIDQLFHSPVISNRTAADRLRVSPQAVSKHVRRFVELGILSPQAKRKYDQRFVADDILDIIEDRRGRTRRHQKARTSS